MRVQKYTMLPKTSKTCCVKTTVRQLLNPQADNGQCDIKLFEMQPDGYSPLHSHPSEHKILVIEGKSIVFDGKKEASIQRDDVIFIVSNEQHQFKNTSDKVLKFLATTVNTKN
jgi:quercetin dioxygenase-like cupin family protein